MFGFRFRFFKKSALFVFILAALTFAPPLTGADAEVWQDPSFKFDALKKIFVLPPDLSLKAGGQSSLIPQKQQAADFVSWIASGVQSAVKKNAPLVKSFDAVLKDMNFIYGDSAVTPENFYSPDAKAREDFFKKALDMGYQAALHITLTQTMEVEHVPERTWTYTVYKEVETYDRHGKKTGYVRIPEEKTEVVPAHDDNYLSTRCLAKLYDLSAPEDDHRAAVENSIYREYQGGPVMKVVENIVKASMKELFTPQKQRK